MTGRHRDGPEQYPSAAVTELLDGLAATHEPDRDRILRRMQAGPESPAGPAPEYGPPDRREPARRAWAPAAAAAAVVVLVTGVGALVGVPASAPPAVGGLDPTDAAASTSATENATSAPPTSGLLVSPGPDPTGTAAPTGVPEGVDAPAPPPSPLPAPPGGAAGPAGDAPAGVERPGPVGSAPGPSGRGATSPVAPRPDPPAAPAPAAVPAPAPAAVPAPAPAPAPAGVDIRVGGAGRSVPLPAATAGWVATVRRDGKSVQAKRPDVGLDLETRGVQPGVPGPFLVSWEGGAPEQSNEGVAQWLAIPAQGQVRVQVPPLARPARLDLYVGAAGANAVVIAETAAGRGEKVVGDASAVVTVALPAASTPATVTVTASGGGHAGLAAVLLR